MDTIKELEKKIKDAQKKLSTCEDYRKDFYNSLIAYYKAIIAVKEAA